MYRTLMMGISVPTAWYLAGWLLGIPLLTQLILENHGPDTE